MQIPKAFTVGRTKYTVIQMTRIPHEPLAAGIINYGTQQVVLARQSLQGRRYTPKERATTFWHELTHAVLHDMQHPLASNEKFVVAFSERLTQAINSARL